jgi:phospholipase C
MTQNYLRRLASLLTASALLVTAPGSIWAGGNDQFSRFGSNGPVAAKKGSGGSGGGTSSGPVTTTPIKNVVVIFQENISFDHYFATYPNATNPAGETAFIAKPNTPTVDNLLTGGLLTENPNSTQPFRMDPTGVMSVTCDQNHSYTPEQSAMDHGLADQYPQQTGSGGPGCNDYGLGTGVVMGYFDGNTVTAMWNYAQYYAMSDNSHSTMYGPSAVGALNLIAGTTSLATLEPSADGSTPATTGNALGNIAGSALTGAAIGDPRPYFDDCVATDPTASNLYKKIRIMVTGKNVGDLLNAKGLTWGWFQGGFAPTGVATTGANAGKAICGANHTGLAGNDASTTSGDYIPHHEPFQYFPQSANPHHTRPVDASLIGTSSDGANHQYDLQDFWTALDEDRLPAVSYLKAAAYQDGHPGYSDPLDEQNFVVDTINALENSKYWPNLAIIIAYDDSDGWYDHVVGPIINQSAVTDDTIGGAGSCGSGKTNTQGQCGYGPRQPLLVISPYAKQNYVDHVATDQSSILRFIEDNWGLGSIQSITPAPGVSNSSDVKANSLMGLFDFTSGAHAPQVILDDTTGVVLSTQ